VYGCLIVTLTRDETSDPKQLIFFQYCTNGSYRYYEALSVITVPTEYKGRNKSRGAKTREINKKETCNG